MIHNPPDEWHVRRGDTAVAHRRAGCARIEGVETETQSDEERRENGLRACSTCGYCPNLEDVEAAE